MSSKNLSQLMFVLIITILLLAGCGGQTPVQPTETATPIPPTATDTSKYVLKCSINSESYGFEITGETGAVQSTFNNETTGYEYDTSGQISAITVSVNRDLVYENNKHAYHIEGSIIVKQATNEVTYNITATGDTFGDSPQTCKKP